jgi:hypothetical protein
MNVAPGITARAADSGQLELQKHGAAFLVKMG